jgi:hypothetical protein
MENDVSLASPALLERFERYFKHPDPDRHVLRQGHRSVACKNAKTALAWLGFARAFGDDPQLYDRELSEAVERFQKEVRNRNIDGAIGPGTRSRLAVRLLQDAGASQFANLDASEVVRPPTIFMSYAWADTTPVDKLDQWLRDHDVRVIRDISNFKPGSLIPDNIWNSVLSADKVIAVYSKQSKARDWPNFEHRIAEQVEGLIKVPLLIYLVLDDTPLKAHDPHRIAIEAKGKTLKQIGLAIQGSLGIPVEAARIYYDEDASL